MPRRSGPGTSTAAHRALVRLGRAARANFQRASIRRSGRLEAATFTRRRGAPFVRDIASLRHLTGGVRGRSAASEHCPNKRPLEPVTRYCVGVLPNHSGFTAWLCLHPPFTMIMSLSAFTRRLGETLSQTRTGSVETRTDPITSQALSTVQARKPSQRERRAGEPASGSSEQVSKRWRGVAGCPQHLNPEHHPRPTLPNILRRCEARSVGRVGSSRHGCPLSCCSQQQPTRRCS